MKPKILIFIELAELSIPLIERTTEVFHLTPKAGNANVLRALVH